VTPSSARQSPDICSHLTVLSVDALLAWVAADQVQPVLTHLLTERTFALGDPARVDAAIKK
jgi:hypothetical protein